MKTDHLLSDGILWMDRVWRVVHDDKLFFSRENRQNRFDKKRLIGSLYSLP